MVVAGLTGVFVNALALLPLGKTDGGRALSAVAPKNVQSTVTSILLLGMAVAGLFFYDSAVAPNLFLYYGLVVVLFQRTADIPPLNDVSRRQGAIAKYVLVITSCPLNHTDNASWENPANNIYRMHVPRRAGFHRTRFARRHVGRWHCLGHAWVLAHASSWHHGHAPSNHLGNLKFDHMASLGGPYRAA